MEADEREEAGYADAAETLICTSCGRKQFKGVDADLCIKCNSPLK